MQAIFMMVVIVVIMIASYGSPSHVDVDSVKVKIKTEDVRSSFVGLALNWRTYQTEFGEVLPIANWKALIESPGMVVPDYQSYSWTYGNNGSGYYFCLTTTSQPAINNYWYEVLLNVKGRMGNSGFVNESCGATADLDASPDFSSLGSLSFTGYVGG